MESKTSNVPSNLEGMYEYSDEEVIMIDNGTPPDHKGEYTLSILGLLVQN